MKKFPLLLAAVAMIAVGSAFASAPKEDTDIYVKLSDGSYQLRDEASGSCQFLSGSHCEYSYNETTDQYTPVQGDVNSKWISTNP